jgi:cytochrome P450
MLSDADLVPFEPPPLPQFRAIWRSFVEAYPQSAYEQPVTHIRSLLGDTLLICDPALIQELLVEKTDSVKRSSIFLRIFTKPLGEGSVFVTEGSDWRWKRKAVVPPFRPDVILKYVPAMAACAEEQVARWRAVSTDRPVDAEKAMQHTAFDIIVRTMLGTPAHFDFDKYRKAVTDAFAVVPWQTLLALLSAPRWVPFPGKRGLTLASRYLREEAERVIDERQTSAEQPSDFLSVLMAAHDPDTGRTMTRSELVDNLTTFIATGHEVPGIALTWMLWLIAKDADTQRRLLAEVHDVAGTRQIASEDVAKLVFTRQVVEEAMRLYSPGGIILRQAKVDMTLGNRAVKAETQLVVPLFALHRNRLLWNNPDAFDPDRFAPDRARARHRYAYMPFGAGPRVCVGAAFTMTACVVTLATLVRALRLAPVPGHKPRPAARITLRVSGGMPLLVAPR